MGVGVARAAYEFALDHAKNRKAFGEAIGQRQSIAFTLADIITDIEAARLLVGKPPGPWIRKGMRHAKPTWHGTSRAIRPSTAADRAVQILAGYGYIRDYPVELWLRNARAMGIIEGIAIV